MANIIGNPQNKVSHSWSTHWKSHNVLQRCAGLTAIKNIENNEKVTQSSVGSDH